MSKIISVTVPDWIYDSYLCNLTNRSSFIVEMIIKGQDSEFSSKKESERKLMSQEKELNNLREENNILKRRIGKLSGKKDRGERIRESERKTDAIMAMRPFDGD